MSPFALRSYVLQIVDRLQEGSAEKLWATREDGVGLIEEVLLEGRACGIESPEGLEELCNVVLKLKIRLPFSAQVFQALTRHGLSELQRIEGLRLSLIPNRRDNPLSDFRGLSQN